MPASKMDLDTPHGRLQYARSVAGYEQEAFGKLMGYSTDGWQKIEQGKRRLTYELIEKVNTLLRLDIRYYFGQLPYHEAVKGNAVTYDDLVRRIKDLENKVSPKEKLDEVTKTVAINEPLNDVVRMFYKEPAATVREIGALVYGYLQMKEKQAVAQREKQEATA